MFEFDSVVTRLKGFLWLKSLPKLVRIAYLFLEDYLIQLQDDEVYQLVLCSF